MPQTTAGGHHPGPPCGPGATVHHLPPRTAHPTGMPPAGTAPREAAVANPAPPHPEDPLTRLALVAEALQNHRGQTLADPATAAAYTAALDLARHLIDGEHATGHLDDDTRRRLTDLLDAARHAPAVIDPDTTTSNS